jgi:spore coat polysaccharide biosynthesis predicted glycosyltransferase SpsG
MNNEHVENAVEKAHDVITDTYDLDPDDVANISSEFLQKLVSEIGDEHPYVAALKEVISLLV